MKHFKAKVLLSVLAAFAFTLSGCGDGVNNQISNNSGEDLNNVDMNDGCTPVVVATSSEKVNLMEELGQAFKESSEFKELSKCATVHPINVTSGDATDILVKNPDVWPDLPEDFWPTLWSPASSVWLERVTDAGNPQLLSEPTSFAWTPVVFGIPETMASTLGYPGKDISYKQLSEWIASSEGWGELGKPLWGSFKIAKTNPNTSTTGLSVLLTQAYANSGKTSDLTVDDVKKSEEFSRMFESGAIHYGDTTGKVLNTLYNATQNGAQGSSYVSAIAVEETSLYNYNVGNPDSHTVQPGETLTPPKEKLVAVYPEEGSMISDNPIVEINRPWVTPEKAEVGTAFMNFLKTKTAQEILPKYGFRPIDEKVDTSANLNSSVGIDTARPVVVLPRPESDVVSVALDQWSVVRKPSAVLELIDISGSMDEKINDDGTTRLEGAIAGAKSTLGNFRSTDEIGIWAFTTGLTSDVGTNVVPVRNFGPLAGEKEETMTAIDELIYSQRKGTPLYDSISLAYDYMLDHAETGRINAIVVLSDGEDTDSQTSLESLILKLNSDNGEGGNDNPVRIFTIAYGSSANTEELKKISEVSGGQMFDASDTSRIQQVFQSVINNF